MKSFVIMNIHESTEPIWKQVLQPVLTEMLGQEPFRVDRHNRGGMIQNHIIEYIETSDVIVADLTNERPNVYLEVGFAMAYYKTVTGRAEYPRVVLTAREDHNPRRDGRAAGDPKVHFDLDGHDILYWKDLVDYAAKLRLRLRERLRVIGQSAAVVEAPKRPVFDEEWILEKKHLAGGVEQIKGSIELWSATEHPKVTNKHEKLVDALLASIHPGWPVIYAERYGEHAPKMRLDGIGGKDLSPPTYTFWELRTNGDFYYVKDLMEDWRDRQGREKRPGKEIWFETRIRDTAWILWFLGKLYAGLGAPKTQMVHVGMVHHGLLNRVIDTGALFGSPQLEMAKHTSDVSEVPTRTIRSVEDLGKSGLELLPAMRDLLDPLFLMFGGFKLTDHEYISLAT